MTDALPKSIPNFPGYYADTMGNIFRKRRDRFKKLKTFGYPKRLGKLYRGIGLYRDGKRRKITVHRLVLETFVGPCPPKQQARHLNDVGSDNRLTNLTWGTPGQNGQDRIQRTGFWRWANEHHPEIVQEYQKHEG